MVANGTGTRPFERVAAGQFRRGADAPKDRIADRRIFVALVEELNQRAERRSELRDLLHACGIEPPSATALNSILVKCQDVDLAFTALTMAPRPDWVEAIAGRLRS